MYRLSSTVRAFSLSSTGRALSGIGGIKDGRVDPPANPPAAARAAWALGLAQPLKGGFDLPDETVDVGGGDRPLGTRDSNSAGELVPIEFLASAVLFVGGGGGPTPALARG